MQTINADSHTAQTIQKLDEILDALTNSTQKLAKNFATFLSPTDTRRFSDHVDDFDQTYAEAKACTFIPIEALLASLDKHNVNYKPVQQTNALLHEMANIMDYTRTVLRANQGGTALLVGLRLRNLKIEISRKFDAFSQSLNALIETMRATPGYKPIIIKIQELQAQLGELTKDGCLSHAQILNVLRLRCKA
jgi:hypothetical protein